MLRVGFATEDITPMPGKAIPGGFAPRLSKGALDPLQARACVVRAEDTVLAVVGVDAVSLMYETVAKARAGITEATGVPERNIIIAASHGHCAGPANDVLGSDADPEYLDLLAEQIKNAVIAADKNIQEAEVACGAGRCEGLAFNRRFKMRDNTERSQPGKGNPDIVAPAGPADPEVGVIAFRANNGEYLGAIGNFACHPITTWGDMCSADYPAYWQTGLKERISPEFTLVFLNGACGDIGPVDFNDPETRETSVDLAKKIGSALAEETARVIKNAPFVKTDDVKVLHDEVTVEYRRPTQDQLQEALELVDSDAPWNGPKYQARDLLLLAEQMGDQVETGCSLDVARIGTAVIAAAPWQPFCEFGLRIKEQSGCEVLLIAAFANGMLGYVPTPQAFIGGGYEPTLCRGSKLKPDSGDRITKGFLHLLKQIC